VLSTGGPVLAALLVALLPLAARPALAHHGSSGPEPVVAADRTTNELLAEAVLHRALDDQRIAGATRDGVSYGDVGPVPRMQPWSDVLTVARAWADRIDFDDFAHNPNGSDQVGHWQRIGENIAIRTVGLADEPLAQSRVRSAADALAQQWWESSTHRTTWMDPAYDHYAVGVDIHRAAMRAPADPREYWVMVAVMNLRDHDGSAISSGAPYLDDGTRPPNESGHPEPRPAAELRDVTDTCGGSAGDFADVAASGPFSDAISCLVQWDVTDGVGDDRYDPGGRVTLGQLAAFLRRSVAAAGIDTSIDTAVATSCGAGPFGADLAWAVEQGVLGADGCDRGGEVTTRGVMAVMVTRALALGNVLLPASPTDWFHDDEGGATELANDHVAQLGIVVGREVGWFQPSVGVTRGQMAVFLAGTIDVLRAG